jgi:hypothetical protein
MRKRQRKKNQRGGGKAWLWKEIRREERKKKKEQLAQLRSDLRRAGSARKTAMRTGVTECRRARLAQKRRCRVGIDRYAKARAAWLAALEHLREEIRYRREMRAIERTVKAREKEKRVRGTLAKTEPRESDNDVRTNIPQELVPLFNKIRQGIKGSARRSRTEEFLEYVEKHPAEVFEDAEDIYAKAAREGERRQAMPNPIPQAPRRRKIVEWANEAGRLSRRGGAPHLKIDSPRVVLLDWLQWNDPNGWYTDRNVKIEGQEPLSLEEAWDLLEAQYAEDEPKANPAKRRQAMPNPLRKTRWSDRMILESVRDGRMMTPEAGSRAFELVKAGLIDARGTWKLTPKGEAKVRERNPKKTAGAFVAEEMRARKKKGRSKEQAIAIGLARARKAGVKVPKKNPRGFSKNEARSKYRRDHWGRGGNRTVTPMTAPALVRASESAKKKARALGVTVQTKKAPDPTRGVLVELGYELASFEFKDARDGRRMRIRLPEKIRPRLAYNASGLVVVGGSYAPPAIARGRPLPQGVLLELGELAQISYVTRKGLDPKAGVEYFHRFGRPRPVLAYGAGGWVILGGSYRVTARGIVG